jgi:hypothetical protein
MEQLVTDGSVGLVVDQLDDGDRRPEADSDQIFRSILIDLGHVNLEAMK